MFQHYLEQHPHDFAFIVDQVWIYNLWFITKFLGQIWWKKDLWVMFSNAKSMTCNLEMKKKRKKKKSKGIDNKKKELNQLLHFLFINSNSNSNSFYSIPLQFQFLELELELASIPIPIRELWPALLMIRHISKSHCTKNRQIWPRLGVSGL